MPIADDILGLDVNVDLRSLEAALVRLRQAGNRLGPAFRASRRDMRADQRAHARGEEGPDGTWAPLSPWTVAKRAARHGFGRRGGDKGFQGVARRAHKMGPVKVRGGRVLGRLPGAIDVLADDRRIAARSRVPWSGVHQDGGVAGRGSRIPARPFLWASQRLLRAVADRIGEHIAAAWRR